jgi:hypothetical protein
MVFGGETWVAMFAPHHNLRYADVDNPPSTLKIPSDDKQGSLIQFPWGFSWHFSHRVPTETSALSNIQRLSIFNLPRTSNFPSSTIKFRESLQMNLELAPINYSQSGESTSEKFMEILSLRENSVWKMIHPSVSLCACCAKKCFSFFGNFVVCIRKGARRGRKKIGN